MKKGLVYNLFYWTAYIAVVVGGMIVVFITSVAQGMKERREV